MKRALVMGFFLLGVGLGMAREKPKDFKLEAFAVGSGLKIYKGFLGSIAFQAIPHLIVEGTAHQTRGSFGKGSEYASFLPTKVPVRTQFKNFSGGVGLVLFSAGRSGLSDTGSGNTWGQTDKQEGSRVWGPALKVGFSKIIGWADLHMGGSFYPYLHRADRSGRVILTQAGHSITDQGKVGEMTGYEIESEIFLIVIKKDQWRSGFSGGFHWRNLRPSRHGVFSLNPDYVKDRKLLVGWGVRF